MPSKKRQPSFAKALVDANRQLSAALKRRTALHAELADLNIEIPNLSRTIAALQGQVEGKPVAVFQAKDGVYQTDGAEVKRISQPLTFTDVVKPLPQITADMGSIPATGEQPPVRELTEDELLQMPDAEDVIKSAPKKEENADTDPFAE